MENYMNEPVAYEWTAADIIREYQNGYDPKMISKQYGIKAIEVREILKGAGIIISKPLKKMPVID